MLQKNMNADQTNPNVYHSIGENNEEHVYDEIKQKEGYKDPGNIIFVCYLGSEGCLNNLLSLHFSYGSHRKRNEVG